MDDTCPFCHRDPANVFHEGPLVVGLWDRFPVSPGHALLVPRRHVATWFEVTRQEQAGLLEAIEIARVAICKQWCPDGFNIGINSGVVAGQTVGHLHVHVIPRYRNDVPDPRGGVRWILPEKADYWSPRVTAELLPQLPHRRALVVGGDDPLLPHLLAHLVHCNSLDIAVAFLMQSGVTCLLEHLRDLLHRGGRLRLLTGDYLGVTEPQALLRLLDLEGNLQLRVFETAGNRSFHPKAYLFHFPDGTGCAYVGSSNLSATALGSGVEWNYRQVRSSDAAAFQHVVTEFEALFRDERTVFLDVGWIEGYQSRRRATVPQVVEVPPEPRASVPEPHEIQKEALRALEATRSAGHTAGLIVLATGLGKTWLSAFDCDRPEFHRVLFVAHRDEILTQAMDTFRRVRPLAHLGKYTGSEKDAAAEVLFASIQTLGRERHLNRFAVDAFDYIVVDEFHHAAASTYRRLIDYFAPKFLLGLTATPERTDGGDLLGLCNENLVFRCDLTRGIVAQRLCPFRYFGVPDEVDYSNIPWRNNRFDEEELTKAVATQKRATNVLEQYRARAGARTLAFCVSVRHAEFTADYFRKSGIPAVAVHSAAGSAPRAASLAQLAAGEIRVVCAVDMFNEGVDVPSVDTIMMLRPTESRILWLQQFGRGLRLSKDKPYVTVIDYIGNHRNFLMKPRALFGLGDGLRDVAAALDAVERGEAQLPPGCEVTYDLKAIEILREMIDTGPATDLIEAFYLEFRGRNGVRPTALECYHERYNPRTLRRDYQSWHRFVEKMGDLDEGEQAVLQQHGEFLDVLETTPLTKSFKLLTLLAMLQADCFPGEISISDLCSGFRRLLTRYPVLKSEVNAPLNDERALRRLLEINPVDAWTGGRGTGGRPLFSYVNGIFRSLLSVTADLRDALITLTREVVEWRLAEYLDRRPSTQSGDLIAKVSHTGGKPILFLPDRKKYPELPLGTTRVRINNNEYDADFVKVAVNVVRELTSSENVLPDILHGWFGPNAGLPGTQHHVLIQRQDVGWTLAPRTANSAVGPVLWQSYMREAIPPLFGFKFSTAIWNTGFVKQPGHLFLLVTLEKDGMPSEFQYSDRFLDTQTFQWHSQNRTTQASTAGQDLSQHSKRGFTVHLFVRRVKKIAAKAAPFIYCGPVDFVGWEGDSPITVTWKLSSEIPEQLLSAMKVRGLSTDQAS